MANATNSEMRPEPRLKSQMGTRPEPETPQKAVTRRKLSGRAIGVSLSLLGGALMWLASRTVWVSAVAFDDKAGESHADLVGATWSSDTAAVGMVALAASIAVLVVAPLARRVIGAIVAVAAMWAVITPLNLLTQGASTGQIAALASTVADTSMGPRTTRIGSGADITEISVHSLGPVLALVGAVAVIIAGLVIMLKPGVKGSDKYQRKATRAEQVVEELAEADTSERTQWDALDADIDPTDFAGPKRPQP